ncbi:Uncharacterised protein [Mycobacterium tuberculosis]|nr:Uncharacterised protein [Mycobacterium tuberculosis]
MPMVLPTWASDIKADSPKESMVKAKTSPAEVTTAPVPAMDRMMPVLMPAWISSLNRETSSRL